METWLFVLLAGAVALLLSVLVGWWLLRRYAHPPKELIERISALSWRKRFDLAAGLLRDQRIPLAVRLLLPALALYLLLPLDIIPDFIPVIGALDDILLVLLVLRLLLRSIPKEVLDDHFERLEYEQDEPGARSLISGP